MGRGRKPISTFNGSEWETVFYNSVGTYVQYINIHLSKEYKLEPLSNHLKIVGGYAFKTAEYKSQGIPIIRISDFNNEQITLKDVVYYHESKDLDKYQLLEGDIIIALTGGTIAKLAIVQAGLGKIYLNQRVGKFQALNSNEFEVEYIYWLARSIQSIIKNLAWGAAIPNVSPKQIEELKFPFPKKETQKGIIDFLNDLKNNTLNEDKIYFDELIENEIISLQEKQITTSSISTELTHQLSLVKKLRQQLLQDAVQGKLVAQNKKDEPASELLKKIKTEKEKLIAEKKIKKEKELPPIKPEEIPFEIPENWVWCRLGEICNTRLGKMLDGIKNKGELFPYFRNLNVQWYNFELDDVLEMKFEQFELEEYSVKKGDLLICEGGYPGRGAIWDSDDESYKFQKALHRVRFYHNIPSKLYLFYLDLICSNRRITEYTTGSGIKHLTGISLKKMPIPLPPLSEQIRIVQKLNELMQYCNGLEESIKQSALQNEKLLQQVLREALRKEPIEA